MRSLIILTTFLMVTVASAQQSNNPPPNAPKASPQLEALKQLAQKHQSELNVGQKSTVATPIKKDQK